MLDESSDTDPLIIKDIRRKMSSRFKLDLEPRKLKELLLDLQTFLDNVPETKLGELRSELKDKNVEQHGSYWYLIPPFEPWLVNYISLLIPRGSYLKPKQLKEIWRSIASLGGLNAKNLEIWSDIPQEKDKDTLVNKELPFIVDQLLHAIKNHYWVSFSLGEFDLNMQHVADTKKDGSEKSPSIKYPLKVISRNGKFFLLARFPNSSKVYHFSLEHIMDLSVIDDPNQLGSIDDSNFKSTELEYITDNDSYGETHLYMYSEPTTEIIIRVVNKRSARNDFFDAFGRSAKLIGHESGFFTAQVKANPTAMTFWGLRHFQDVEVLEPVSVRKEMQKSIRELCRTYDLKLTH